MPAPTDPRRAPTMPLLLLLLFHLQVLLLLDSAQPLAQALEIPEMRAHYGEWNMTRGPARGTNKGPRRKAVLTSSPRRLNHHQLYVKRVWRHQISFRANRNRSNRRKAHQGPLHPCEQSSCYPATGNLLIGRLDRLSATSTCGLRGPERYCIVSHLKERKKCFFCDASNPERQHNITNIVSSSRQNAPRTWWQAENGIEHVNVSFALEAEFHFTHIIITFQTFRPKAMIIERSYDFGKSWHIYRYFAHNCAQEFPGVPTGSPEKLTDVICDSHYSSVEPSEDGQVVFRVLPTNLKVGNPYTKEVQNLLKITNLRIRFVRLHTLGDDFLDSRHEIREKYYYAIKDMVIRGSCSCYGHAQRCSPLAGVQDEEEMIHGRCECTHHTRGLNCEVCEDFYNDLPWKPAVGKQTNACRKCNCNGHSSSCHFDSAVYERSGRVSGGVCENCQHSTRGQNCELCKPFFYHEHARDISDPQACQPCDCDARGSLDEGLCEPRDDPVSGEEAGHCHCKGHVDGRRCDRCRNGYWNFTEANPEGCQPCTCHLLGTVDNHGCNTLSGECTCKRYVTGRDCDRCQPEFYGLSADPDGCKPCECDPGGAEDNHCDLLTGQCKCRPHVAGRTCNTPEQSFYTGSIDFLIYEAEFAKGSNIHPVYREPLRDGRNSTWTGFGFMQVVESSALNFTINDVRKSIDYDIIVRYEATPPGTWEDALLTVIPELPPDPEGPCRNYREPVTLTAPLPVGQRSSFAYPTVCLEAGRTYTVLLQIKKLLDNPDVPTGALLIDSIVLNPNIDSIPWFAGGPGELRKKEFNDYNCEDYKNELYYSYKPENENQIDVRDDVCRKYLNSIGLYVFDGGHDCQCNPTGSSSRLCDSYGGHCLCKPNVVGRRCDQCAPGTYGFGPEGCVPCDCDSVGALDNFCELGTGQCKCRPNTYGRTCGQCEPGFWNFPHCKRCECNGHADTCDSRTGACAGCRDSTTGHDCDRCAETFYGDPRIGVDIPCRPCPCPGSHDSGHSFANRCSLDPITNDVICECFAGYAGPRCESCADNYYGSPELPGGHCQPCECNGNVEPSRPGNCHPQSGECLQCLYETAGPHCEHCRPDYFGEALAKECRQCNCYLLGTDMHAGPCDHRSGQCPCLPNVEGQQCIRCRENHWRIASGRGCDPCECDVVGSLSDRCNEYNGTCECKPGFGGTRCNECQENFWGNPNVQCYDCDCEPIGSASLQCERTSGLCQCKEGIGGDKCDMCARSYIGSPPSCSSCGECFENWDRTVDELKNKTHSVIAEASNIQKVGTTGVYSEQFNEIDGTIRKVQAFIDNSSVEKEDVADVYRLTEEMGRELEEHQLAMAEADRQLQNVSQRVNVADSTLKRFKNRTDQLHQDAAELKESANRLQVANVQGALNVTQQMAEKSRLAERMADDTGSSLSEADRFKKFTETLLATKSAAVTDAQQKSNESLIKLNEKLDRLKLVVPGLNLDMCGRNVSECSDLCGGAGCGYCGGLSCDMGAFTKAKQALDLAKQQSDTIQEHKEKTEQLLRELSQLKKSSTEAHEGAGEAFKIANLTRHTSDRMIKEPSDLKKKIIDLLNEEQSPAEIRKLAEEVISKGINDTSNEIRDLAKKIEATVATLDQYSTENILKETSSDLELAKDMERRGNYSKNVALEREQLANRVVNLLRETEEAQRGATVAISKAKQDIAMSEKDLNEISEISKEAKKKADDTTDSVAKLESRLKDLQTESVRNEFVVTQEIKVQAQNVSEESKRVEHSVNKLEKDYESASERLTQRVSKNKDDIQRAKNLLRRASELTADTQTKYKDLEGMESVYKDNDRLLAELMDQVDSLNEQMKRYLMEFEAKAQNYSSCTT